MIIQPVNAGNSIFLQKINNDIEGFNAEIPELFRRALEEQKSDKKTLTRENHSGDKLLSNLVGGGISFAGSGATVIAVSMLSIPNPASLVAGIALSIFSGLGSCMLIRNSRRKNCAKRAQQDFENSIRAKLCLTMLEPLKVKVDREIVINSSAALAEASVSLSNQADKMKKHVVRFM